MNENEILRRELGELRKRLAYYEQQPSQGESKSSITQFSQSGKKFGPKEIDLKDNAGSVELTDIQHGESQQDDNDEYNKAKRVGMLSKQNLRAKKSDLNSTNEDKDIETSNLPGYEVASLLKGGGEGDGIRIKKDSPDEIEDDTGWTDFGRMVTDRAGWLVGLLVLQSMSSFIIQRNETLLQRHPVIVRFLTMLVGAGGNAGNQASVRVIRGLAVGTIRGGSISSFLKDEFTVGLILSVILGIAGCLRAAVFLTPLLETSAITTSLVMIVMISVLLGATLPLGMKMVGIDPAHSSTTIQVLMDILGVTITVVVSGLILDSHVVSSDIDAEESGPLHCSCLDQDYTPFNIQLCPNFTNSNETQCFAAQEYFG